MKSPRIVWDSRGTKATVTLTCDGSERATLRGQEEVEVSTEEWKWEMSRVTRQRQGWGNCNDQRGRSLAGEGEEWYSMRIARSWRQGGGGGGTGEDAVVVGGWHGERTVNGMEDGVVEERRKGMSSGKGSGGGTRMGHTRPTAMPCGTVFNSTLEGLWAVILSTGIRLCVKAIPEYKDCQWHCQGKISAARFGSHHGVLERRHILTLITIITMSSVSSSLQASSSSTPHFQPIFEKALEEYKKRTGEELTAHPLAAEIKCCDSPDAILAVLEGKADELNQSRSKDDRLTKWLSPTVNILNALSATLGESIGSVFPPTKIIFSGIGILLVAAKSTVASRDVLAELFDRIESFFRRLKTYTEVPPTQAVMEVLAKVMAEVLSILAIATKGAKEKRTSGSICCDEPHLA
ncbi:hypothetical protein H4582DRAFT_2188881 [Lactarius indigo]|nr:hypothetical protein H4582DRAFT_2188881 [Lactarius indigo]